MEEKRLKPFKMPTAYTILLVLIAVMAVLTWVIPSGQYDYVDPAAEIKEPIAGTYHQVQAPGQSVTDAVLASFKGFYGAIDIATFILMVGGFLGVVMKTGAIDAGIANVIRLFRGKEKWMIVILMCLFSLGGTTFGMAEETIAFYPLLLPVFIAAGYDAVTAVSVILIGAGMGVLGSTVNPFATGIAAGFAGISIGEGILLRVVFLILLTAIGIWYVLSYGEKVRKNPGLSYVADQYEENLHYFLKQNETDSGQSAKDPSDSVLSGRQKVTLILFALTFLIMIYSVIPFRDMGIFWLPTLGWWFEELSGLFFIAALIIALFYRLGEEETAEAFVKGCADLLGVAFIIGISRGITVIMNNGMITDTILHWGETALSGAGSLLFVILTYLFFLPLSFLIPSTSGLATLSMPIMAPLGDFAGVGRDLVITAFQSASGILNLITPTSAVVMGALAMGRISYDKWLRYVWKLILIVFVLSLLLLAAGTLL